MTWFTLTESSRLCVRRNRLLQTTQTLISIGTETASDAAESTVGLGRREAIEEVTHRRNTSRATSERYGPNSGSYSIT